MTKTIRVDHPGSGARIAELTQGFFHEGVDHCLATYDGDRLLGGFIVSAYYGNTIFVHDGADGPAWCTRELLWLLFGYIFGQLGCATAYAPIRSDNYPALSMAMRAGWKLEHVLMDAVAPGMHVMLLRMSAAECPWFRAKGRRQDG